MRERCGEREGGRERKTERESEAHIFASHLSFLPGAFLHVVRQNAEQ